MKVLLIGEYSNVHWTLAEGLRALGHEVTVVSNGDFWKDYRRDIDLSREYTKLGGVRYALRLLRLLPKFRGYDVVQLINPMFLELKAERIFPIYKYLRRHNRRVYLGAFGMDYYWVSTCVEEKPLRYSDFNLGDELRTNADALRERADWVGTAKERLNRLIAEDCDGIIAGLYEYYVCYHPRFPQKTTFIPFPIETNEECEGTSVECEVGSVECDVESVECEGRNEENVASGRAVRIFIGINRTRSEYKGTDIMLKAAQAIKAKYPERIELRVAESVPFVEYVRLMAGSDAILDQLYSYTPSMNPLEAMKHGIICIGGGEPENYEILGEEELRPIINVQPNYDSVYHELEQLVLHPERVPALKEQSRLYVKRHHDSLKVARQYEAFYMKNH
ncbi:MAG: glycosyltransferase family 1 protein [Prevotella sp.]|nr:glycosyltransferase family 1 protein [Prevotella sp.]